jgi:hypothetical protein
MAEGRRGGKKDMAADNCVALMADIEPLIQKAVAAAMEVIRAEFVKRLAEFEKRFKDFETEFTRIDEKCEDVENRLAVLETNSSGEDGGGRGLQAQSQQLEAIQKETRQFMQIANDTEQYNRRNNLRIHGLSIQQDTNCCEAVKDFVRSKLHLDLRDEDIDIAHVLPSRGGQPTNRAPAVIVRFQRREKRDNVLRARRVLKGTPYSVSEDLTSLNVKTMNRLRNSDRVRKTWSWNGRIYALLTTGRKLCVRPFQTIDECLQSDAD